MACRGGSICDFAHRTSEPMKMNKTSAEIQTVDVNLKIYFVKIEAMVTHGAMLLYFSELLHNK